MTLIETLIGALIFAFVTAGVYMMYTTMQNTLSRGELMSDLQQNARIGLAQMTQEIRMAGYDPSGVIPLVTAPPKSPIRAASSGCFSFVADVSGDGTARQITYLLRNELDGTVVPSGSCPLQACPTCPKPWCTLRRRVDTWQPSPTNEFSGGSFQALAGSLNGWMNLISLTYYDANNQVLTPAAWTSTQRCPPDPSAGAQSIVQLTFDQMRVIRRVAITLKAQGSRPGVFSQFFTLTNDVHLRNL